MIGLSRKLMQSMKLRPLAATLSLLALIALAACTHKADIDPAALETPTLLVERLPITVGVHYDQALVNHYQLEKWYGGLHEHEYRLGPPTKVLFDQLFSTMFEAVVPVESSSTSMVGEQQVQGVLSLALATFVAPNMAETVTREGYRQLGPVVTSIGYSMTLYAPPGVKKTTIRVHGKGPLAEWEMAGPTTLVARAMQEAAAELVVEFHDDADVKTWLARLGVAEHGAAGTSQ